MFLVIFSFILFFSFFYTPSDEWLVPSALVAIFKGVDGIKVLETRIEYFVVYIDMINIVFYKW